MLTIVLALLFNLLALLLPIFALTRLAWRHVPLAQWVGWCAAILIDYASNVFELCLLRPELRYWQERLHAQTATAPQIANFCKKTLDALAKTQPEYDRVSVGFPGAIRRGSASAMSGACRAISGERSARAWRTSVPISTSPSRVPTRTRCRWA